MSQKIGFLMGMVAYRFLIFNDVSNYRNHY